MQPGWSSHLKLNVKQCQTLGEGLFVSPLATSVPQVPLTLPGAHCNHFSLVSGPE
ncbi:hypothetical protein I79_006617 [Cricetulus griseus]|uniref:Uncharacterized protein n=1 Tax=Cricetulus griseus TaxID=10029 RepID=G3H8B7_CRIGR|nr:hypothetical protein I79_006617 [Cricetulus griseus]